MTAATDARPAEHGVLSGATAVIPARGGSKGIPGKNLRPLLGRPLLVWTIEAALAARRVSRVAVSSDDAEILAVAAAAGAETVQRPADLSGDTATSESALLHTLDVLRERAGADPQTLAFLQCTSPLTAAEDVDGTLAALDREAADSAVAVVPFHHFLWRRTKPDEPGADGGRGAAGINHDPSVRLRRQDKEAQFLEAGAVYAFRTAGFREAGHRFFGKTALYEMPAARCWEIDDPTDLLVAEALLKARDRFTGEEGVTAGPAAIDPRRALLPSPVSAVIFDFDGTLTDNRVWVDQDGRESAACDRGDGWGITALRKAGVPVLVCSTEVVPIVAARCRKLNVPCVHGLEGKESALRDWFRDEGVDPAGAVFLGNDVNDLGCFDLVGCPVAVADAHPVAARAARFLTRAPGGRGAARELCDLILDAR